MTFAKLNDLIDGMVLAAVCTVSLLYSIYFSDFAEMHVQFSFLDFPIFVGEIILAFCAALSLVKFCALREGKAPAWTRWHYVFVVYCLWMLAKALHGYIVWGPLALRNAALFYYPVFAFIAYALTPKQSSDPFKFLALILLGGLYFAGPAHEYFVMAYCLGGLTLCNEIRQRGLKIAGAFVVLAVGIFSIETFFSQSRSNVVASLATLSFIIIMLFLFFRDRLSRRLRWAAFVMVFILCALGLWKYADHNGLKTLVAPVEILDRYHERLAYVKEHEDGFAFKEIEPRLYNSNKSSSSHLERTASALDAESMAPAETPAPTELPDVKSYRPLESAFGNIVFRMLIWHDMMEELRRGKAAFGISFGKPQRSKSIEITRWAFGEWSRDGYITPHNSFLHVIYRAGIVGVGLLALFFWATVKMLMIFIRNRSLSGIFLMGILIYWSVLANFLVVLELPYFAIPFWSLYGFSLAYAQGLRKEVESEGPVHP